MMEDTAETTTATRDAVATRRRILDTATNEFAAAGLAGGRIARIAEQAQINQRMIYAYYGSKNGLFDAVLEHQVLLVQSAVDLDPSDLPAYAQQVFDVYRANPQFVRLALWQALERPNLMQALVPVSRTLVAKVHAIAEAQKAGLVNDALPADRLLDHILALALGNLARAGHLNSWTDEQRHDLGVSVRLLTTPRSRSVASLNVST